MTTAYAPSRPAVSAGSERLALDTIARLRGMLDDYRAYRRTLAELRKLDERQLTDIGYDGHDLDMVARTAVGN